MTINKTRRLSRVFGLGLATCFAFCTPGMQLLSQGAPKSGDKVPAGSVHQMIQGQEAERAKATQEFRTELEKLKETDPAEYKRAMTSYTLMAQMILGELGYGTLFTGVLDEQTQQALRAYQEHNGLTVSGAVEGETLYSLTEDEKVLAQPANVVLPPSIILTHSWDEGHFSASGSWFWEGDPAPGTSTSKFESWRERMECVEARAVWLDVLGFHSLSVALHTYEIERWDTDVIVTVPEYDPCGKTNLYIQRHDERVLQFEIPDYRGREECKKLRPSAEVYVNSLEDGSKIYEPRHRSRKATLRRILRMMEESKRAIGLFER